MPIVHVLSLYKQTWGISYSLVLVWVWNRVWWSYRLLCFWNTRGSRNWLKSSRGRHWAPEDLNWDHDPTSCPPSRLSEVSAPRPSYCTESPGRWIHAFTSPIWYHADCALCFIFLRIYNRQDTTGKHCFVMHWLFLRFWTYLFFHNVLFQTSGRKHSVYIGVRCACRFHS